MAHVTAPLIGVRDKQGRIVYLHQGAELPDFVPPGEVKRLTDIGLVSAGPKPAVKK